MSYFIMKKRILKHILSLTVTAGIALSLFSGCGQKDEDEIRLAEVVDELSTNTASSEQPDATEDAEEEKDVFEPGLAYRDNPVAKMMVGKTISYEDAGDYFTATSYLAEPVYLKVEDIKNASVGDTVTSSTGHEYEKTAEVGEATDIFNNGSCAYWEIDEMHPFYNGFDGYAGLADTFSYDEVYFNRDDSESEIRIRKDATFQKIDYYNGGIDPNENYTAEEFINKNIAEKWESEYIEEEDVYRKNLLYILHFDEAGYVDKVTYMAELCEWDYLLEGLVDEINGVFLLPCYEITEMSLEGDTIFGVLKVLYHII